MMMKNVVLILIIMAQAFDVYAAFLGKLDCIDHDPIKQGAFDYTWCSKGILQLSFFAAV